MVGFNVFILIRIKKKTEFHFINFSFKSLVVKVLSVLMHSNKIPK